MVIRIRIPAPSSMLLANLLAVLGLVAVVAAVGGLAGVWWAVLTGGLFAVVLGWVGMTYAAAAEQTGPAAAAVEHQAPVDGLPSVRAVEEPAAA
jgi:peptidoglycan/LPS O-acetylase OafA/YrhL